MNPGESKSVLLIEDHADIAEMVGAYLENREYIIDYAADGITGLHLAVSNQYDAIILDLMLPGMDGLEVCQKIRDDAKSDVPIIMLTARDTLEDKISGLDRGADDYLIKPFAIQELEARLRSLIRRYSGDIKKEVLSVGELSIDTSTLKVQRGDKELAITPIGLKILSVLMRASPAVVSRRELERQVWGDILPDSDTLRSHLYNLRKIVDKPFEKKILLTVQGNGFKIIDSNETA
ncbi:MAG: response regulator transcription factor [Gammaproteobacteria bacterium]|jgi:DNA-binding response OmpR family regulator|nr:response regulator transcription factor [Gammaproteobacteria bacterium]